MKLLTGYLKDGKFIITGTTEAPPNETRPPKRVVFFVGDEMFETLKEAKDRAHSLGLDWTAVNRKEV